MPIQILLGIAAVVLPVLTYFAGVQRTERRYEHGDRQARINHVAAEYLNLSQGFKRTDTGLSALIKAGIWTLKNDREIREVVGKIMDHGEESPFGAFHDRIMKLNLWEYFKVAKERGYDFQRQGDKVVLANEFDHLN